MTGIAVGASSSLYIYKNFKPYYKYNIPSGGPTNTEKVILYFIQFQPTNLIPILTLVHGNTNQAEITQLAALPRSTPDISSSSLLLVGTEHNSLLIIDPHTFNAISRVSLSLLHLNPFFSIN